MVNAVLHVCVAFDGDVRCSGCRFRGRNESDETWCSAVGCMLSIYEQDDETMRGRLVHMHDGSRPDWCPLKVVV